jgi:hypothetical protein
MKIEPPAGITMESALTVTSSDVFGKLTTASPLQMVNVTDPVLTQTPTVPEDSKVARSPSWSVMDTE